MCWFLNLDKLLNEIITILEDVDYRDFMTLLATLGTCLDLPLIRLGLTFILCLIETFL